MLRTLTSNFILFLTATLAMSFSPSFSWAGSDLFEPIYNIRQNGMGGVYVFHNTDASSLLHNPSYTCFTKGINWTLFDLNGGFNGTEMYNTAQSVGNLTGLSAFNSLYGKRVWAGAGGHSTFTSGCFGFSAYDSVVTTLLAHNPAFPNVDMTVINDMGVLVGGAIPFSSTFSLGLSAKRVTRTGGTQQIGTASLSSASSSSLTNQFTNKGDGYGLDVGVTYRNEAVLSKPTLSIAWRDVGSTAFVKSGGEDAPEKQKDNLVMGLGFSGEVPLLGFAAGLEYRHIADTGMQIGKKLHMGMELSLAFLDVRAGFYQGYTSYGLGMDLWLMRFDVASYSVETGAYAGQSPDARIQASLGIELSFDPNFKLTDAGGKRRRLKQRR